jgi:hypothetical protein
MTEDQQVQAIQDAATSVANALSLGGHHVQAAHVAALIQLNRALYTRLVAARQPPPAAEAGALALVPGGKVRARINADGTAWVGGPPEAQVTEG